MKGNPYDSNPEHDFVFPDSDINDILEDTDVHMHFNLDDEYDADGPANYDAFNDPSYVYADETTYDSLDDEEVEDDSFYEEDGEIDLESMSPKERRAYEKQIKKQEKRAAKRGKNREILIVMYCFVFLFMGMIGYFVHFNALGYKEIMNHPGNIHIAKLQEKNTRGRILASDGTVLAQTQVDAAGNEVRVYPYANVFSHVVGVSKLNKSGLESSHEAALLTSNTNAFEKVVNELKNQKSPGDDIVTTLDLYLQQVAYSALGDNQGVVIAMEPSTGKILAMVSKPDYNPNTLAQDFDAIISDPESKVLLNQATSGLFTPGSIFKICTTLEYVRENKKYSNYSYTCSGHIDLDDGKGGSASLSCYHGNIHGTQDLALSFANSCNASFAEIGTQLDNEQFTTLLESLFFNQELPTSIAHEKSIYDLGDTSNQWLVGATAIGQGNTAMTPLHAVMLTSAIANGGLLMEPYLVDSIQNNAGNSVAKYMPESYGSIMTSKEASLLTDMMVQTVNYGTAYGLSYMGYSVAGKTGTAEVDNSGNNAWFVGFAPAEDPEIAICVLVEDSAYSSSEIAVPIAQQLFYAYLNQ